MVRFPPADSGLTPDVELALVEAHRSDWALVLAATAYYVRDLDLAEECVQEAYATAIAVWPRDGVPRNPAAWLTTAAKRRAIDAMRREATWRSKMPLLVVDVGGDDSDGADPRHHELDEVVVPDERLRLIFMCCHPALSSEAQSALTLRLVCGMSTTDIARAFLVTDATMAARITRATRKIATARIPLRVPVASELGERLAAALRVIYLVFTVGHTASSGDELTRPELVDEALHLSAVLAGLLPDEPEVLGLFALLLCHDARRATRVDVEGRLIGLSTQDRSRWNTREIATADELVQRALVSGHADRYVLQAQIALEHARAASYDETDWARIVELYDQLLQRWPSPVVALNRCVAVSMVRGPAAALELVNELDAARRVSNYHYLPAVKADLLRRLDRLDEARVELRRALELVGNEAERAHLLAELDDLDARAP